LLLFAPAVAIEPTSN